MPYALLTDLDSFSYVCFCYGVLTPDDVVSAEGAEVVSAGGADEPVSVGVVDAAVSWDAVVSVGADGAEVSVVVEGEVVSVTDGVVVSVVVLPDELVDPVVVSDGVAEDWIAVGAPVVVFTGVAAASEFHISVPSGVGVANHEKITSIF